MNVVYLFLHIIELCKLIKKIVASEASQPNLTANPYKIITSPEKFPIRKSNSIQSSNKKINIYKFDSQGPVSNNIDNKNNQRKIPKYKKSRNATFKSLNEELTSNRTLSTRDPNKRTLSNNVNNITNPDLKSQNEVSNFQKYIKNVKLI